ncbi:MAG: serine/threonine-protein kinase [Gemmatimonadaceae bacterium]
MHNSDLDPTQRLPVNSDTGPDGRTQQIGPYRILSILGQGGMGLVYLAEQSEPVRRRVALKIIKVGMDTRDVVARFEAERQALAVMDHPGIARVLDAGTTSEGRPYFVMELVKGLPITEYCNTHRVTLRERLTLFIEVCMAVQHAHQKSVIHRDLKPSNILVTEHSDKAAPKVIDFGIAKALSQPLTEQTLVTEVGRAIGTAAYMSPEQANPTRLDVDTRTDIYSLGVMLYELLVGQLPLDPASMGLMAFLIRLSEREAIPDKPSARMTALGDTARGVAEDRRTDVRTMTRELKGDLDWIIMKALEPDRSRRYATAEALAQDIQRYLASEPITARPPSNSYRLSRFVQRHKRGVFAGTGALLLLMASLIFATTSLVRARRAEALARSEAQTSQQVAAFLEGLFRVSDPGESRGNTITAREILDRGAQRVRNELAAEPVVQGQLMHTMGTVYKELGLFSEAQPLLAEAVTKQRQALGPDHPAVRASALELARINQQQGKLAEAESLYREVKQSSERVLIANDPAWSEVLIGLGGVLVVRGKAAEAETVLVRARNVREQNHAPDDVEAARLLRNLGGVYMMLQQFPKAEPLLTRSLAVYEKVLGPDHPDVGRTLINLGVVNYYLERYPQADDYYRRAESLLLKTVGPDHPNVASVNINLGEIAWKSGRWADAESRLNRALEIKRKTVKQEDPGIATIEYDLGNVFRDSGRPRDAEPHYQKALAIREAVFGLSAKPVAEVLTDYAKLLRQLKREADATRLDARAVAILGATAAPAATRQ